MHLRNLLQYSIAGSLSLLAFAATAQAADITVTNAEIAGGKLVVTGTTATANTRVRLDGKAGAAFNTTSNGGKAFSFSVAYAPSDCVVSLQKVNPAGLGAATDAVVANCARGLSPRGAWSAAADYSGNDVVTYKGASWLARRDSTGSAPAAGADWQQFAQAGSDGTDGSADAAARRAPPDGPAGGDLAGTYPNPTIKNLAVTAAKLANDAVTTIKIQNDAVTANKIHTGAVDSTKIVDNGVTNTDIANDAVTARNINDGAVGAAALANNAVTSLKIATGQVTARTIFDGAVQTEEVRDDTLPGGGLAAVDLQADSVGSSEIQDGSVGSAEVLDESLTSADLATDSVQATEVADNSIDAGEIVDFGLTNQDVGVLFAQVNADGTLAGTSGGLAGGPAVTSSRISAGVYQVDFGFNVSACAFVMTQGEAGVGGAGGAITGVTDRAGNANAVFATTRNNANTLIDTAFQLVAVC